jgi:hypothetical protein
MDMTAREAIKQIKDYLRNTGFDPNETDIQAIRIALAALEAQEPRVLAVEELAEWNNDTMLFVEAVDGCDIYADKASVVKFRLLNKRGCWRGSLQYYGRHIRVWNNRPTAEQMAAEPWL